jgi:integrase/recombinase XerD
MGTALATGHTSSDAQLIAAWLYGRPLNTQRAYAADIARFTSGVGKPLPAVTLNDLQEFAATLEHLAVTSQYRMLSAVKSLLAFGCRIGYLSFDAGQVLRLPATRNRLSERILPEADVHRMLSLETNDRNRALLTLLYASGIRVSELCELCWRDVQPADDTGQITVFGKGGLTRSVRLPAKVWSQVAKLRGSAGGADEPVFRSRKKRGSLKPMAVFRIVRKAAARAGIELPVSPHWLRHAHASHALDRGAPIHLVQATLGHASINTTGRYLHARPKDSSSRFLGL